VFTELNGGSWDLVLPNVDEAEAAMLAVAAARSMVGAAQAARLFPSGSGWFQASRHVRITALSKMSG
jgi:hypothetical protein